MKHKSFFFQCRAALLVALTSMALQQCLAQARPLAVPAPPNASIEQKLGASLQLDSAVHTEDGRSTQLGQFFHDGKPVLLVFSYYTCPQLCGLVMHGLLESLAATGIARDRWRIVSVSIDPQDTSVSASARREADLSYDRFLQGDKPAAMPLDIHLLTATASVSQQLAAQAGFNFSSAGPDSTPAAAPGNAPIAHATGVIVLTPQGRISRYLMGIDFDAGELAVALADAAGDRLGSLTGRISLLCSHFDPATGKHTSAVMDAARILGVSIAGLLAFWCWKKRIPKEGSV